MSTQALPGSTDRRQHLIYVWSSLCVLLAAFGVVVLALADRASRQGDGWKHAAYWGGLVLIIAPISARLVSPDPTRNERLALTLTLGVAMYLVKVDYSPSLLAFSDEFVHVRSVHDDLRTGHLFSFNPLLPIASRYPGIGILAATLAPLSGIPVATAGLICIGAARIVLMLSLFLIVERTTHSARAAGLACIIYTANPNFLYWSAQFSYESLALPLVLFALYLILLRSDSAHSPPLTLAIALCLVATVVTHHLSSYALAGALIAWSLTARIRRRRSSVNHYAPFGFALAMVVGIGAWLILAAPITTDYLQSIETVARHGLVDVLTGSSNRRVLFAATGGSPPTWVRAISFASVGLLLASLCVSVPFVWRRRRHITLVVAFVVAALYPLILPLRFVGGAQETATRSTEFLYIGVGTVIAVALTETWLAPIRTQTLRSVTASALAVVVVLGGIAAGWQYNEDLPPNEAARGVPFQPYTQELAAARWAATALGPGKRFASDAVDKLSLAAIGGQRPLSPPFDGASSWQVLLPGAVTRAVAKAINEGHVQYAIIERKLSQGSPDRGYYFDLGEPGSRNRRSPLDSRVLGKFDRAPRADRIFDSGLVQIYRVSSLG